MRIPGAARASHCPEISSRQRRAYSLTDQTSRSSEAKQTHGTDHQTDMENPDKEETPLPQRLCPRVSGPQAGTGKGAALETPL